MDKKITQRIIGVFVLIALVIIVMPLFFSKNESSEVASVSVPSTPSADKPIEIKQAESTTQPATPDAVQTSAEPAEKLAENTTPAVNPVVAPVPDNQDKIIADAATCATPIPQLATQQETPKLPVAEQVATADSAADKITPQSFY